MKKNILLTGHDGFIGKKIKEELKNIDSINNLILIEKNFIDSKNSWESQLQKMVQESDYVIHVGAISDTMLQDANTMMKYNFEFSKVLFDISGTLNKTVIYSSSAANTGESGLPSNIYGWSKYVAEQYGISKVKNFIALRYFNVYGPGEEHKEKMASVAYQAWLKKSFKLFPGYPRRDFVFIDDVVSASIFPVFNKIPSNIYEVGSGKANRFEDVLDLLKIKYSYHEKKKIPSGYQFYTKADPKKFLPGWKPKYSIENGMSKYIRYLND